MMTDTRLTQPVTSAKTVTASRFISAGLLAAALAAVANLLVYFLIPALFGFTLEFPWQGPGSEIQRLPIFMVLLATVLPTIAAIVLLAVLNRFTARPVTIFRVIAVVFLLLSLAAPLTLSAPLSVRLTLVAMHVITAAIITYTLTNRIWSS